MEGQQGAGKEKLLEAANLAKDSGKYSRNKIYGDLWRRFLKQRSE